MASVDLRNRAGTVSIAAAFAVSFLWYVFGYRPLRAHDAAARERIETLSRERDDLFGRIASEKRLLAEERLRPVRAATGPSPGRSPAERLRYFLQTIAQPANDLELAYFAVTPLPPASGPGYEEVPFAITVAGGYAALADYLYQLEYAQRFVVRDLAIERAGSGKVRAEFRLAALLPHEAPAASPPAADPGRPTSLELARDPFLEPPAELATAPGGKRYFLNVPPGLHLSGIMESQGRRIAIINHEPYRVGMKIDNKTITRIDERGVELADEVRSYFLEMAKPPARPAEGFAPESEKR